jgi:hypothetical protein
MQSSCLIPSKFYHPFFSKMPGLYIAAFCTGETLLAIIKYLPLSYKDRVKTSNTDQCLSPTIRRLQRMFPFVYADNANRSNIPSEIQRHNPDNCHNKDKRHFYLLWYGLDFHCDSWLAPPISTSWDTGFD